MQEVVKRMQEKQKELPKPEQKPKEAKSCKLCLARANGDLWPVTIPNDEFVYIGDLVFFEVAGRQMQGVVEFLKPCLTPTDGLWIAVTLMAEMEPVRAIKAARISYMDWGRNK